MEIYLPQGNGWIDYWDKRLYKGGETIDYDTSDPEKLPLFVRNCGKHHFRCEPKQTGLTRQFPMIPFTLTSIPPISKVPSRSMKTMGPHDRPQGAADSGPAARGKQTHLRAA